MTGDAERGAHASWAGRTALALFLLNSALLFFPPIPPYVKGSLWSYVLKTLVVALVALELYRRSHTVMAWWDGVERGRRLFWGVGTAMCLVTTALLVRRAAPELFGRSIAEVGPWETISTAVYAGAFVLLWRLSSGLRDSRRRHLRLVAAGFALLLLEETDYAGIFGGLIGRVDGIYVGSLHDLVHLAVSGHLPSPVLPALVVGGLVTTFLLARHGYLQPRLLRRTLLSGRGLWLSAGLGLLVSAGLGEAGLFGSLFEDPSAEEVIEMGGSVLLAVFALQAGSASLTAAEPVSGPVGRGRRRRPLAGRGRDA